MKPLKLTPRFRILVKRPDWENGSGQEELIFSFSSDEARMTGHNDPFYFPPVYSGKPVISFSFESSLADPASGFSLTLVPAEEFLRKIELRDFVYLFDDSWQTAIEPCYIGVVTDRRYSARMGEKSAQRAVTIAGKSLGYLLTDFQLVLDLRLFTGAFSEAENKRIFSILQQTLAQNSGSYADAARLIKEGFSQVLADSGGGQPTGLRWFLDNRFLIQSDGLTARYPKVMNFFQSGENNLAELLQFVTDPPWGESYYTIQGENLVFKVRSNPFFPRNWSSLNTTALEPLFITAYDLGNSDESVKTVFGVTFPGSGIDQDKARALDYFASSIRRNENLFAKYGYRPLFLEQRFFDRSQTAFDLRTLMSDSANDLSDLYSHEEFFLSGSIQVLPQRLMPKIGEKVSFAGGEFYVESLQRTWNYLGTFMTTLRLTRGAIYDQAGNFVSPLQGLEEKVG